MIPLGAPPSPPHPLFLLPRTSCAAEKIAGKTTQGTSRCLSDAWPWDHIPAPPSTRVGRQHPRGCGERGRDTGASPTPRGIPGGFIPPGLPAPTPRCQPTALDHHCSLVVFFFPVGGWRGKTPTATPTPRETRRGGGYKHLFQGIACTGTAPGGGKEMGNGGTGHRIQAPPGREGGGRPGPPGIPPVPDSLPRAQLAASAVINRIFLIFFFFSRGGGKSL